MHTTSLRCRIQTPFFTPTGNKLAFSDHEDPPSEDEIARQEAAALAKCRAIEGDEDDEEEDIDEKTKLDTKEREYEDNEIVYL